MRISRANLEKLFPLEVGQYRRMHLEEINLDSIQIPDIPEDQYENLQDVVVYIHEDYVNLGEEAMKGINIEYSGREGLKFNLSDLEIDTKLTYNKLTDQYKMGWGYSGFYTSEWFEPTEEGLQTARDYLISEMEDFI